MDIKFYRLPSGRYLGINKDVPKHLIEQMGELIEAGLIDTSYEVTYSEEEFQLACHAPPPTWNNTLTKHSGGFNSVSMDDLFKTAHELGYTYFCWNEHVYKITEFHGNLTYERFNEIFEMDIK